MEALFYGCESLDSVDLSDVDTSALRDARFLFLFCSNLEGVDLSDLDTRSVTDMKCMFQGCESLKSIDLSALDTGSVTDMGCMFNGCESLANANLSGLSTGNVTTMEDMFRSCESLVDVDVSGFDTRAVTTMEFMFADCYELEELDLSSFETPVLENTSGMFAGLRATRSYGSDDIIEIETNLHTLDISSMDMSNVSDATDMFKACGSLREVALGEKFEFKDGCAFPDLPEEFLSTGKWIGPAGVALTSEELVACYDGSTMSGWYRAQMQADTVGENDAVAILYSNGDMVFQRGPGADPDRGTVLAIWTGFEDESVVPWRDIESGSRKLFHEHVKHVSFSDAIRPVSTAHWFDGDPVNYDWDGTFHNDSSSCIESIDLTNLDTSRVTSMRAMFAGCKGLESVDVSVFDTSSVTDMFCMFQSCVNLKTIDVSGFDTSHVTNMAGMFCDCESLESADLSSFDMGSVEDPAAMEAAEGGYLKGCYGVEHLFDRCPALVSVTLGANVLFAGHCRDAESVFPTLGNSKAWLGPDGRGYSSEGLWKTYQGSSMSGVYTVGKRMIIASDSVTGISSQTYTGKELRPAPTVKVGGKTLALGTDYSLSYSGNTNAGTAKVVVTGRGGYVGTVAKTFTIEPASITAVTLKAKSAVYDGKAHKPAVNAVAAGALPVPASSKSGYSVAYLRGAEATTDFTSAGAVTVKVTGKGDFTGSKTATFTIKPTSLTAVTLKAESAAYDGKAHKPAVNAVAAGSLPVPASSKSGYSVTFLRGAEATTDFTSAGAVTVKVTGKGDFTGSATATFKIGQAANPMKAMAVAKSVKLPKGKKALAKAAVVRGAVRLSRKAVGTVTYTKVAKGSAKRLSVNKKTGKVTVAKGTKAGTYKMKVKVKAAGNKNYSAKAQKLTVTVRVKK